MKPATLATIQNDRLLAICDRCANTVELNVRKLIEKYGRVYEVPAIKRHLRCPRCGSVSCAVQLALLEK